MGIRIKLPGIILVVIGIAGMAFLGFYRQEWTWPQMTVLGVVAAVGAARTLKGS